MSDHEIQKQIETLATEERALYARADASGGTDRRDAERLKAIAVELDRCWDLLRQRRALRAAGKDPAGASPRNAETVENFLSDPPGR